MVRLVYNRWLLWTLSGLLYVALIVYVFFLAGQDAQRRRTEELAVAATSAAPANRPPSAAPTSL